MDTMRPDERAAGVISGSDPYRELELYLEKVNEEIGEVFDRWKLSDSKKKPLASPAIPIPSAAANHLPPRNGSFSGSPTRLADGESPAVNGNKDRVLNGHSTSLNLKTRPKIKNGYDSPIYSEVRTLRTNSLPLNSGAISVNKGTKDPHDGSKYCLNSWSDNLLAEFNSIIANELHELQSETSYNRSREPEELDYDDVFVNERHGQSESEATMRLRISRSRSWDNRDLPQHITPPTSPPTSPTASDTSSNSSGAGGVPLRTLSLTRVLRKNRNPFPSELMVASKPGDAVLVRIASLPDADVLHKTASDSDLAAAINKTPSEMKVSRCDSTGTLPSSNRSSCVDLAPRKGKQVGNMYRDVLRKGAASTEWLENGEDVTGETLGSGVAGREEHNNTSGSLFGSSPRSRRAARYREATQRRFPQSDESLEREDVEQEAATARRSASGVLPVALQSFLTKIRPRRSRGPSPGRAAFLAHSPVRSSTSASCIGPAGCCFTDRPPVDAGTQTSPALSRSSSFTWVSDCSSSMLLLTPPGSVSDAMDDNCSSSSSSADNSSPQLTHHSAVDCSYEDCDCASSRDSLSDSPLGSLESPEREEPESGIGTASPPRSKDHRVSNAVSVSVNKPRRKETWERLRRRQSSGRPPVAVRTVPKRPQEVWIRRESVETQTGRTLDSRKPSFGGLSEEDFLLIDSSSGIDGTTTPEGIDDDDNLRTVSSLPLPNGKCKPRAVRPHCLPVKPQHLRSVPSPVTSNENLLKEKSPFTSTGPGDGQQPSPSSASLKLITTPLVTDLGNKSSSAPLLVKQAASSGIGKPEDSTKKRILTQPRSQSERHLAEIEAAEACKWLRAAGFPQYAQLYEDLQFPIDVSGVQKDHPSFDPDSLQSLFRRLHALNRCAKMKVDNLPKSKGDDSDEDDHCALSENWTFQPESRRWSRVCDVTAHAERLQALSTASQAQQESEGLEEEEEDPVFPLDRLSDHGDEEEDFDPEDVPVISSLRYGSLPPGSINPGDPELLAVRFRRTGSERLRDGAKAILRRMESLKSRRRRRQNREGVVISGPQVLDVMTMQQRMKELNCVDVSPTGTSLPDVPLPSPTPPHATPSPSPFGDDSSSYCSDGSSTTPPHHRGRSKINKAKKLFRSGRSEDPGAMSDSEVQPTSWRHQYLKDANSNHTKVLEYVDGRSRGPQDLEPVRRASGSSKSQTRTGSLNMGKESQSFRDKLHLRKDKSGSSELTGSQDSSSTLASQADSDHEDSEVTPRHKAVVVRWHSFQRGSTRPDSCLFRPTAPGAYSMGSLSCGQLLVLRKLALLKLTACMERYCPTHRTGWNWELPKFIRKIKAPDYKDKTVFGVPLLLSLQRNGQALPKCIQSALRWLRVNSLDQVGLFRKSGVRSRIQKLKLMTESQGENISYEGQQAYDVADMVKQYFRELPEALLTNKLSETFIAIFQHVPTNLRAEAVQCVLLLLPDEHREALQTLLEFLNQVSARSACNQMTASNLAVCLAPSLFHLHHAPSASSGGRSSSASPRRRKTVGVPDPRELSENKAAHECLLYLIKEHRELFIVSEEMMAQCNFNYMDQSIPVALEELGTELHQDWRGYLYTCTTALLKEARDKSRGWVGMPCSTDQQVDMAYKKVGDGHPLRLWRVSTEVEAPPQELLQRVLRERHVWDYSLLKWRVVARLDPQVEVFQYVCANMAPLAAKDFCVLRSWRSDLPKGACVIVETSVEHPDGPVMLGGVRGIVLASRYLIEPCGSGKSRIMHLSRVDTKGRTPEWYNKSYGHICALHLARIRGSFRHTTDGPESKV